MTYEVVRKLIRAVGLVVAVAIGLFIPLAFGMIDFIHLQRVSQNEADFHANYISRMAELGTIQFSPEGLQGIVSSIAATSPTNARLRILDEQRNPLLEWGPTFMGLANRAVGTITLGGEPIGSVEVANPIAGLLHKIALLLGAAGLFGVVAYLAVTAIPVQALSDASQQIEQQQQMLSVWLHQTPIHCSGQTHTRAGSTTRFSNQTHANECGSHRWPPLRVNPLSPTTVCSPPARLRSMRRRVASPRAWKTLSSCGAC